MLDVTSLSFPEMASPFLRVFKHKYFSVSICKSTGFYKVNGAIENRMSWLSSHGEGREENG